MPPRQSCPEALPFLLYTVLSLKSKKSIWEPFHGEDNTVYRTPVTETLEKANFPPIWKAACPEDVKSQWGADWDEICALFDDDEGQLDTRWTNEELKKLSFKDLLKLVQEAKQRRWGPDMDDMVANHLDQLNKGVREVYNTAVRNAEVPSQWWPCVDTYSGDRDQVLKYLWGNDAFGTVDPNELLKLWWGNTMSRIIEKEKKARDRGKPKLEKLLREVERSLGADFLKESDEAAAKFSTSTFLAALRKLTAASELLGWEVLLPTDYAALEAPCPDWTPEKNQAFFDGLTPQAQKHEKVGRSLGWMMKMLRNKGSRAQAVHYDVEEDLDDYVRAGYRRGAALADSWPQRLQNALVNVAAADVVLFAEELRTFANEWQQREHVPLAEDILQTLTGGESGLQEWLDGGDDLGVEHHAKLTDEQLDSFLGMEEGYSPVLQRHVAKDPAFYQPGKDEPIAGQTVPLKLRHHQRVAVVAIYQKIVNTQHFSTWPAKLKNLPGNALLALRENWGSVPGNGLWDTVGLGKTWTMGLVIAVYIVLYEFQQRIQTEGPQPGLLAADKNGKWSFGTRDAIPDALHIIVVPNSLVAQWRLQLERIFVAPAVSIIIVDPKKAKWVQSMTVSDNVPKYCRIYLISITTLIRMADVGLENRMPRMPKPGVNSRENVFGMSYRTMLINELHDLRTGAKNHASVSALISAYLFSNQAWGVPL